MNNLIKFRSKFMRAALMLTLAVMTFPTEARAEKIPYAELSSDGKTLTFKYEEHTLGSNEWDVSNTVALPGWDGQKSNITTVVFEESFADARPTGCLCWFNGFKKLATIEGLSYLNTSSVRNMSGMFCGCESLQSLDISNFNTSNVINMWAMFNGCENLYSLDLSNFDTSKVNNMSDMFRGCSSLKSLAIGSGFTVGSESQTSNMFLDCTALAEGMLIVNGTTVPTITQNIFSVFTNGTLATNLTKNDLGITGSSSPFNWKGGKFRSVGKVKIPYIDENGKLHDDDGTKTPDDPTDDCADALPITSANGNVSYGAGWYFVAGNVTINGQLMFTGDAHIILCDGAKMTVTSTDGHAIYGEIASLAIYGQSTGNNMGSLTATGSGAGYGIYAYSSNGNSSVTINGGQVTTTGGTNGDGILANSLNGGNSSVIINGGQVNSTGGTNRDGIQAYSPHGGDCSVTINGGQVNAIGGTNRSGIEAKSDYGNSSVTINGGQVTATGGYNGIEAYSSTSSSTNSGNSSVTINGGQVNATGGNNGSGIEAYSPNGDANITLGWTNADDYIYANSYSLISGQTENMMTADGKSFVVYDGETAGGVISGIVSDLSTIKGKTLRPAVVATVTTKAGTQLFNVDATNTTDAAALQAAVTAVNNATSDVTLKLYMNVDLGEADVTFDNTNTVGEDESARLVAITLDLNGKTISGTGDRIVNVKSNTALAITNSGSEGGITAKEGNCIRNYGTLTLNGSPTLTGFIFCILNYGTLTLNGSPTLTTLPNSDHDCINNIGSLTLNGQTTFSSGNDEADICLETYNNNIGLGTDFVANSRKIKVRISSTTELPYIFTNGYGANVKSDGNIIDPADIFVCRQNNAIAGLQVRLVGEGDAAEVQAYLSDPIQVAYIDADGNTHDNADGQADTDDDMVLAYKLTGTETHLGKSGEETWYVTDFGSASSMTYDHTIGINGTVHIILADGKQMIIGNSVNDPADYQGIQLTINGNAAQASLNFYGQSDDANACGKLSVYCKSWAVDAYNVTVNGGTIEAYSTNSDGISADNAVTINGGQVTATGGTIGKGISAGGDITLGWRNADDFINASSYSGTVKIADGQYLTYEGNTGGFLSGTLSTSQIEAIAGKTLRSAIVVATVTTTAGTESFCVDATNTTDVAALQAAVTAVNAATSDVTLKLFKNVDLGEADVTFDNTVAITLDLNGKTLSGTGYQVVWVKENTALAITNSGSGGGITASNGECILNNGTLTLNGAATLTSTEYCIVVNDGMVTLNGQTTFSCGNTWADIGFISADLKIGFGTDFVANNSKIKVLLTPSAQLPYTFTSGYGANVKSSGTIIDPADIFVCRQDNAIAGLQVRLVGEGDAAEVQAYLPDPIPVAYIDANGKLHDNADGQDGTEDDMAQAYKLTGTETLLGKPGEETWYVTDFGTASSMTYNHDILIDGTVHIILADGKHMKIGNSVDDPVNDKGISATWNFESAKSTIYFYGQSTDYSDNANACGKLSIYSTSTSIYSTYNNLVINGGIIEAYSTGSDGISVRNVTINGGQVTATGGTNGKGIDAGGDITLGWRNATDFIQANSYSGTVKIAEGQYFTYEGNTGGLLSGTLSADQVTAIAGKKLTPVVGHKVTVPARQYMTYFSPDALTLGTEQTDAALYTITSVGTDAVTLSDALTVASKETPLLVYNGATTEKDIFLYITAEPTTKTAHADEFKGTATAKEFSADDMKDKQCYVLAGGKMFVRVEGTGTIAAHRCWLELPNSNTNAARQLNIGNGDEPTGIGRMDNGQWIMDNYSGAWFSLDGRKLEGQPKRKGVYIRNGKKIAQSRRER